MAHIHIEVHIEDQVDGETKSTRIVTPRHSFEGARIPDSIMGKGILESAVDLLCSDIIAKIARVCTNRTLSVHGACNVESAITPSDLLRDAKKIADQLLGMSADARVDQLACIKASDEVLHAIVKSKLEDMRKNSG